MPGDASTDSLPGSVEPAGSSHAVGSLIGRVLGKFTVVEHLGSGGAGDVFRAEQSVLGRSVVIKVLRGGFAAPAGRIERFLREAKLASRLDHPYAAHIYAFGAETDRVLWIAMEHVKGATLDELITRRGPMPPTIFAPLFARLCEVVHSAHELGIVHRDIKGSNVMVIERAGQLLPKLLDFGIAKDDATQELPGSMLGTPKYMAPEQWLDAAVVDFRADIYALGVLAYRCLAGRVPFEAADRLALSAAHRLEPPPPLTAVSPPLASAVMRALEKAPEQRWPDAMGFANAVRNVVGATVTEAVPIFDPATRDAWLRAGPQPIADAVSRLAAANTTVEADAALRSLVAIAARWLAVVALASANAIDAAAAECARALVGHDEATPWIRLARAAGITTSLPALVATLAEIEPLEELANALDARKGPRTATALAVDVALLADAFRALEPLLAYSCVVGIDGGAESWQGIRRRARERVVVWGDALAEGEVALIDAGGRVVARLTPFVQASSPLPAMERELFLLWRAGRGPARLVAAPWGFERDDAEAGQRLAAIASEDADTSHDPEDDSPYLGLAAYGVADAERFFGREREVEALVNRLVRAPMVAVLGPSGVGKSSFIHAGLSPRLAEQYQIVTMRPGRHPMQALSALLGGGDVVAKLRAAGEAAPRGVVIVIDQLEEMTTLCSDPDERTAFSDTLASAADSTSAPVRVVVTLRDDFATMLESSNAFSGRFEVFVLATPPPDVLRRIIVEPARRSGVAIDPEVVADVVSELAGRPASLPLLSFTVARLWQTRDRASHRIDHASYVALGGVAGALSTYADQIYDTLGRREQGVVRDLFARLVAADGTRIPAPRAELEQLPGARGVLEHLIDARLLVARDDDETDSIEIVHECLAERWQRLARWRSEDAADARLLDDVRVAARRWHEKGRPADLLWRGEPLAELRRLVARSRALTDIERAFAAESDRVVRRARNLRRNVALVLLVALAGIAGTMTYLGLAARSAAMLAQDRLTGSLVAQGRRELNDGRAQPALAYFAAAMRRGADGTGLRTMVAVASRGWRDTLLTRHAAGIYSLAAAPDGSFVTGDHAGVLRWWSRDGKPLGELAVALGPITRLTAAGGRIAVSARDGVAVIADRRVVAQVARGTWNWAAHPGPGADEVTVLGSIVEVHGFDGKLRRRFETGFTGTVEPVFTPDGAQLFVFDSGRLAVLDLTTMVERELSRAAAYAPAASGDGRHRGFIDTSGAVHFLDEQGATIRTLTTAGRPDRLVFSPTGDRYVLGTGGTADVYVDHVYRHSFPIEQHAAIAIRGDDAWTTDRNGTIQRYRGADLVASIPAQVAAIDALVLAGDVLASRAIDASFALVRADAVHVRYRETSCNRLAQRGPVGIGLVISCGTAGVRVHVGADEIATFPTRHLIYDLALHEPSGLRAIAAEDGALVLGRDGKPIARLGPELRVKALQFVSDRELVVLRDRELARWTLPASLTPLASLGDRDSATAVIAAASGILVGRDSGRIDRLDGTQLRAVGELGDRIEFFAQSSDRKWIAATLSSGRAAILDSDARVVRVLEATGQGERAAATTFDATGDLLVRGGNDVSIWDRATGDRLISDLDLLRTNMSGRFLPDGRLEVNGVARGVIDIPRETRPVAEIVRDIECRVPLRATGERLEPAVPRC